MIGTWFTDIALRLDGLPILQGTLAALSTFLLEDPTTVACGLLVADGRMDYRTALVGLTTGIAMGDFGLYFVGRYGFRGAWKRFVKPSRRERMGIWLEKNLVLAMLATRFLPGMRIPSYTSAGALMVPWWKFFLVAVVASFVWTVVLLNVTIRVGEAVFDRFGKWKLPIGIAFVGLMMLLHWRLVRRERERRGDSEPNRDAT